MKTVSVWGIVKVRKMLMVESGYWRAVDPQDVKQN